MPEENNMKRGGVSVKRGEWWLRRIFARLEASKEAAEAASKKPPEERVVAPVLKQARFTFAPPLPHLEIVSPVDLPT